MSELSSAGAENARIASGTTKSWCSSDLCPNSSGKVSVRWLLQWTINKVKREQLDQRGIEAFTKQETVNFPLKRGMNITQPFDGYAAASVLSPLDRKRPG